MPLYPAGSLIFYVQFLQQHINTENPSLLGNTPDFPMMLMFPSYTKSLFHRPPFQERAPPPWEGGRTGPGLRSGETHIFRLAGKKQKHIQRE